MLWKHIQIGYHFKDRFRMVLRREQILKIACNHYITSAMTLNPMNTSETAVCWYAIDYTDGNPIEEQFALKFKVCFTPNELSLTISYFQNKDILQEFIKLLLITIFIGPSLSN